MNSTGSGRLNRTGGVYVHPKLVKRTRTVVPIRDAGAQLPTSECDRSTRYHFGYPIKVMQQTTQLLTFSNKPTATEMSNRQTKSLQKQEHGVTYILLLRLCQKLMKCYLNIIVRKVSLKLQSIINSDEKSTLH